MIVKGTLYMALLLSLGGLIACEAEPERIVTHRSNCEVCHLPRDDTGSPHGIEQAHPWAHLWPDAATS